MLKYIMKKRVYYFDPVSIVTLILLVLTAIYLIKIQYFG